MTCELINLGSLRFSDSHSPSMMFNVNVLQNVQNLINAHVKIGMTK